MWETELIFRLGSDRSRVHNGSLCDLAENSLALDFSSTPEVLGQAIAGTLGPTGGFAFPGSLFNLEFLGVRDLAVQPYTLTSPNDGIVEVESAYGRLDQISPEAVADYNRYHSEVSPS